MPATVQAAATTNAQILSALEPPPNVVVVGGTAGIGRAIALSISKHCPKAHITIIGRNESAANAILAQMGSNSAFIRTDASLMSEIRATAQKIKAVDMLVLSQGVINTAGYTPTVENIDYKGAISYYGRVLFVQELLPLLRSSPHGGKVLFVLNSVRGNPSKVNWDDMTLENSYSLYAAFNQGMVFTDLTVRHLGSQPENTNVLFTHAYPGYVRTDIGNSLPAWIRLPFKVAMSLGFGITPEDCAEYMVYGMLGTDKGFRYIDEKGEPVTKKKLASEDMVQKVWEHTLSMISSSQ